VTWNRLVTAATNPVPVVERRLETRTDSAGRYAFCGLPEGVKLTARAIAEDRRSTPLELKLAEGEVSVVDIVVGTPAVVAAADPAKTAAAAASTRAPRNTPMQQFERRRRRGSGSFLTRAQIDRQHASRLTDLLRTMAGVTVEPDENGSLVVLLRRSTMFTVDARPAARSDSGSPQPQTAAGPQMSVKKCPAAFQLDGLPIDGGATADLDVKPEQVEAIEVYPGGQVPIELGARTSMCGVVFIWTRYYAERPETGPGA